MLVKEVEQDRRESTSREVEGDQGISNTISQNISKNLYVTYMCLNLKYNRTSWCRLIYVADSSYWQKDWMMVRLICRYETNYRCKLEHFLSKNKEKGVWWGGRWEGNWGPAPAAQV